MESADCELEDCPVWWSGEWSEVGRFVENGCVRRNNGAMILICFIKAIKNTFNSNHQNINIKEQILMRKVQGRRMRGSTHKYEGETS